MSRNIQYLQQKIQTLTSFITYLSKKGYNKCYESVEKMQASLANQAKTCIKNTFMLQKQIRMQKEEIKQLEDTVQLTKKLKGFNLVGDQLQNNNKLFILSLVQKGSYKQAQKQSSKPLKFISQLLQYEQLKKLLEKGQEQNRGVQGSQYNRIKNKLRDTNQAQNGILKLFSRIHEQQSQSQWRKPNGIQQSVYKEIRQVHSKIKSLNQKNKQLTDTNQKLHNSMANFNFEKKKENKNNNKETPKENQNNHGNNQKEIQYKIVLQSLQSRVHQLQKIQQQCKKKAIGTSWKIIALIKNSPFKTADQQNSVLQVLQVVQDNILILQQESKQLSLQASQLPLQKQQNKQLQRQNQHLRQLLQQKQKMILVQHYEQIKVKLLSNIQQFYVQKIGQQQQAQKLAEYQKQIEQLQKLKQKSQQYKNKWQQQISKYKQVSQELQRQKKENQQKRKQKQHESTVKQLQFQTQKEKLKKQSKQRQQLLIQMRGEMALLQNQIKQLKQKLRAQTSKYKSLEKSFQKHNRSQIVEENQSKMQGQFILNELKQNIKDQTIVQLNSSKEQKHKEQLQQLKDILKILEGENTLLNQQLGKNSQQLIKLQDQLVSQRSLCSKLTEQLQQLKTRNDQLKMSGQHQKIKLADKATSLQSKNKELAKKLKEEKDLNQEHLSQIAQLNSMIEEIQKIRDQQRPNEQLNNQDKKREQKLIQNLQFQKLYSQSESKADKLNKANAQLSQDNQTTKVKIVQLKELLDQEKSESQRLGGQLQILTREVNENKEKLVSKEMQIKELITHLKKIQKKQPFKEENHRCLGHLFTAKQVFENGEAERLHLIRVLQQEIGTIHQTKLLYAYDPLNRVNFHRYIDNHKNLLVVMRTAVGKHIAAYSESELSADGGFRGKGLLMPLWDLSSVFYLTKGKRSVSYDDYFLIYGNSEIRIRSQENKVFSNFGIANGYFDNQRKKVEDLIGERQREIDLDTYEVYEVIFERDLY